MQELCDGISYLCVIFGLGGLGGYLDRGEGLVCSVCLLTVSAVLGVISERIGEEK